VFFSEENEGSWSLSATWSGFSGAGLVYYGHE